MLKKNSESRAERVEGKLNPLDEQALEQVNGGEWIIGSPWMQCLHCGTVVPLSNEIIYCPVCHREIKP